MPDEESFTYKELRRDLDSIGEITKDWREKMEYLPADQVFAAFRRAVTHLEKAAGIIEKILSKYDIDGE